MTDQSPPYSFVLCKYCDPIHDFYPVWIFASLDGAYEFLGDEKVGTGVWEVNQWTREEAVERLMFLDGKFAAIGARWLAHFTEERAST